MGDKDKDRAQLLQEVQQLRRRVSELEDRDEQREELISEMRLSQERLRTLAENTPHWVWEINRDLQYTYVSPLVGELLGYEVDEVLGRSPTDFMSPEDAERAGAALREYIEEGQVFSGLEHGKFHKNGEVVHLASSGVPVMDKNGEPQGLRGIDRDISRRWRAQERLRRAHAELEKRVEQRTAELHEANEKWRLLVENSLQYTAIIQGDPPRMVFAGPKMNQLLGFEKEDLEGAPLERVLRDFHPQDREKILAVYESRLEGDQAPDTYEVRFSRGEGWGWLQLSPSRIEYEGEPAVQVAFIDVTERKEAEEALHQSEQRYRTLVDSIGLSVATISEDMRVLSVNATMNERHPEIDFSDEPVCYRVFNRPGRNDVCAECPVLETFQDGEPHEATREALQGDEIRTLRILASPLKDEEGNVVGATEIVEDVTEKRRAEQKLEQEHALMRTLMNSIPDSIYVKDMESRYITANTAHVETMGAESVQELEGKTDYDFLPDDVAERYYSDEQEVIWSGEPMLDRVEPIEDDEGHVEKWFLTTKVPFRDDNGKVLGLVGVSHDITARKEAEDALDSLAQDLARSNAELEQFAYVVSHDLQEPLRMVASYVDLISERYAGELDDKAREFMSYAVDGARRMQQMINDLLSYSRVSTRGKPFTPVDCNEVLGRALSNLQVRVEQSNAEITSDDLPTVLGDESQLCQVFQNLLANAIKFHSEETPRIHVGAQHNGSNWEISVRDNGIGIDPDDADRVFVIFRRLHDRDEYAGTGIGLAICKKIVERHGGHIWVESEPGEGATLYFTLPESDTSSAERNTR